MIFLNTKKAMADSARERERERERERAPDQRPGSAGTRDWWGTAHAFPAWLRPHKTGGFILI